MTSSTTQPLKRAKKAQQENPPATPPLEFRAVEPGQSENRRVTLLVVGLSLVFVAVLGLAGVLVWFVSQSKPAALPVAARVADAPLAPLPKLERLRQSWPSQQRTWLKRLWPNQLR